MLPFAVLDLIGAMLGNWCTNSRTSITAAEQMVFLARCPSGMLIPFLEPAFAHPTEAISAGLPNQAPDVALLCDQAAQLRRLAAEHSNASMAQFVLETAAEYEGQAAQAETAVPP